MRLPPATDTCAQKETLNLYTHLLSNKTQGTGYKVHFFLFVPLQVFAARVLIHGKGFFSNSSTSIPLPSPLLLHYPLHTCLVFLKTFMQYQRQPLSGYGINYYKGMETVMEE